MTNKNQKELVSEATEDYTTQVLAIARQRCELIEDQYSRTNYAWSQCNSTFYLQNKAKVTLADKRAELNSAIAEQEADNTDGIPVDGIVNDAKENAVGYALANALEMLFQHNADLTLYKELAGRAWTPPTKSPTGTKKATSRHFDSNHMKKMADQLLNGVILTPQQ